MGSLCMASEVGLSCITTVIGIVVVVDCYVRKVPTVLVKFRVFATVSIILNLLRDSTRNVEKTYLPGTLLYAPMLASSIGTTYLLENFLELLSAVKMAPQPTRLLKFYKYFRVGFALYVAAAWIAFLLKPTQGTDVARMFSLILLAAFAFVPASWTFGSIGFLLRSHLNDVAEHNAHAGGSEKKDVRKTLHRTIRSCIVSSVAIGFAACFFIFGAVLGIISQLQRADERYVLEDCRFSNLYAYGLTHIIYWLVFYLTRAEGAPRRNAPIEGQSSLDPSATPKHVSPTTRSARSFSEDSMRLKSRLSPVPTSSTNEPVKKFATIKVQQADTISTNMPVVNSVVPDAEQLSQFAYVPNTRGFEENFRPSSIESQRTYLSEVTSAISETSFDDSVDKTPPSSWC